MSHDNWTPFKRNGKLRIVFYTDPWWKRLYARIRREPLWHQMGAMTDGTILARPVEQPEEL